MLLAGYFYADWTTKKLTPKRQALLHIGLILIAIALLPIIPDSSWKPTGEEDYASYLHWLGEALGDNECQLHAYAMMTNHVHLLLTPKKAEAAQSFWVGSCNVTMPGQNITQGQDFKYRIRVWWQRLL